MQLVLGLVLKNSLCDQNYKCTVAYHTQSSATKYIVKHSAQMHLTLGGRRAQKLQSVFRVARSVLLKVAKLPKIKLLEPYWQVTCDTFICEVEVILLSHFWRAKCVTRGQFKSKSGTSNTSSMVFLESLKWQIRWEHGKMCPQSILTPDLSSETVM